MEVAGRKPGSDSIASRTLRRLALAEICDREIGPDDYFARMRGAPGFVDALADCIQEL